MRGNSCVVGKILPQNCPKFHCLRRRKSTKKGQKQAILAHFCLILVRSTGIEPASNTPKPLENKGIARILRETAPKFQGRNINIFNHN